MQDDSQNEELVLLLAFISQQIRIIQYSQSVTKDSIAILKTMQAEVMTTWLASESADDIEIVVEKYYKKLWVLMTTAMAFTARLETAFLNSIDSKIPIDSKLQAKNFLDSLLDKMLVAGAKFKEVFTAQKNNLIDKLKAVARMAGVDNITPDFNDVFDIQKNHIRAVAHTWLPAVSHNARMDLSQESGYFKGYRHLSVLDGRTTTTCRLRNNKLWDKNYQPVGHDLSFQIPPLHWWCRSGMILVTELDNQPDVSEEDWVKSQSLDQLQQQFGKKVGQWLQDGKITLSDLLKDDGLTPMSMRELAGTFNLDI